MRIKQINFCEKGKDMTKEQAKEEFLLVWNYIVNHPEVRELKGLPLHLLKIVQTYIGRNPLCEYMDHCYQCPLKDCGAGSLYHKWATSGSNFIRKRSAKKMIKIVSGWDLTNESQSRDPYIHYSTGHWVNEEYLDIGTTCGKQSGFAGTHDWGKVDCPECLKRRKTSGL